ncbi:MAG TPA: hypothetical protein VJ853_06460 [Thermoanaerobaculia bacterium]|nr:hypothetical protein [Thermoanaerobaculia bacterium]
MLSATIFFAAAAALFTARGFLPGRVMLPLDVPRDAIAWKGDPAVRVAVSNRLLSDPVFEYYAWDSEIRRLVANGEFPWRNRFAGDGAHLFANPETSLLFPLTWIRLALGDYGWAISLFLKLFFAGFGMWWFARELTGCDWRSALAAGFAYLASGFMTVWLLFPHTNVFAVLPWLAFAVLRGSVPAIIATSALATAGGHPETLCYGVIALAIFLRPSRKAVLAAAIGFFICAVQLVPFLIALRDSDILATRSHRAMRVRPFAIPATILPGYLGSPLKNEIDLSGVAQPASENFSERSGGYAGAVALLAVAFAWRGLPRRAKRGVIIGIVALVLSWVSFSIAATERLGLVFVFFICAALGAAIDTYRPRRRVAIAIVAAAVLIAGVLVATPVIVPIAKRGIAMLQRRHYLRLPAAAYDARLAGYLAGLQIVGLRRIAIPAACVLAFALATRKRVVAAATVIEAIAFAYGFNPIIDRSQIAPVPAAIREIERRDPQHQYLLAAAPEVYPPNMATINGLRDVRSYDVLQPRSRVDALRAAGYDAEARAFAVPPRLPGVRWFLANDGLHEIAGAAPQPLPRNDPPPGLALGAAISILALVAAAVESFFARELIHDRHDH